MAYTLTATSVRTIWKGTELNNAAIVLYDNSLFINFRDFDFGADGNPCRQWINIKKFDILVHTAEDQEILAALIDNEHFRDDYIGGGVDPDGTRHGPFWTGRISPSSYEQQDHHSVADILNAWLAKCGMLPSALVRAVDDRVIGPVIHATSVYVLRKLDAAAINDYGFIHTEFHEIVLIDRSRNSLLLVVAADD